MPPILLYILDSRKNMKEECVLVDQKTLAYINMYAVLGTLENLCELDPAAGALLNEQKAYFHRV